MKKVIKCRAEERKKVGETGSGTVYWDTVQAGERKQSRSFTGLV